MAHISKLSKWGLSRCVVIPRNIVKEMGWYAHQPLLVTAQNGVVVIQSVQVPRTPTVTNVQEEAEATE